MVQQVKGQKGFEAWNSIVRRCCQRNKSDNSSIRSAEQQHQRQGRAQEQFDDMLRTFMNLANKDEGRFGKIKDEEKTLSAKNLMPESLLTCRIHAQH